jgi:hypothetical protein
MVFAGDNYQLHLPTQSRIAIRHGLAVRLEGDELIGIAIDVEDRYAGLCQRLEARKGNCDILPLARRV